MQIAQDKQPAEQNIRQNASYKSKDEPSGQKPPRPARGDNHGQLLLWLSSWKNSSTFPHLFQGTNEPSQFLDNIQSQSSKPENLCIMKVSCDLNFHLVSHNFH